MARHKMIEGKRQDPAAWDEKTSDVWAWLVIVNDTRLNGFIDKLIAEAKRDGENSRKVGLAGGAFEVRVKRESTRRRKGNGKDSGNGGAR